VPHGAELRAETVELFEVALTELAETPTPEGGEGQVDDSLVAPVRMAPDQPGSFRAVDELDRAVVPEQEGVGHLPDGRAVPPWVPPHGEQQLVLCRGEADGDRLRLAPVQEAAEAGPELEQTCVVGIGKIAWHIYIVSR
jgi:hypothetical protein